MKGYALLLLGLLAGAVPTGCGVGEDKGEAEYFAGSFFETVKVKDFDTVLTFYSPKFFEKTPREEWRQALRSMNAKLGDLQEYRLVGWNFRKYYGTTGSGTYFELRYRVSYATYPADETLTIFKPLVGGELQILGHNINSEGFLKSVDVR